MINPQNHIAQAIISTLSPLPVWLNRIPRAVDTPSSYVLITDMSITETARAKDCYEWLVGFNLDVTALSTLGYDNQALVNNNVQTILPKIKSLTDSTVEIKNVDLISSRSMVFDTATKSVTRQILTYEVWCNYQEV